jgi:hypothetical protein
MIDKWRFARSDNTVLQARPNSTAITRWSGSSTWENERWLRDETSPETLDYYVATIPFLPVSEAETRSRLHQGDPQLGPMPGAISLEHSRPFIDTQELAQARVPPGLSADEVLAHLDNYRREQMAAQAAQMTEAARMRQERLQAVQLTRQAARRARAQAEIASAYPHRESGEGQLAPLVVVSADDLRAARAARRLARQNEEEGLGLGGVDWLRGEGEEGRMTVDGAGDGELGMGASSSGSGSGSGKRKHGGALVEGEGVVDTDAAAGAGVEIAVEMNTD